VVLPGSTDQLLYLRPLGGSDDEQVGIYTVLEDVYEAQFELPHPQHAGDFQSARLLRDAVRLGFRSSAGPFRSFGSLAFEPRPYQLVPLLMGLKLDPVRLLIADDVGIGKTVEACLIARELLDRGDIQSLAVLCPPQLAEQWQEELRTKFHIDAELVLSSTARRLERGLRLNESIFDHYPFVVISTDFIKSDRRRDDFVRTAPDLVIVDEAHTAAPALDSRSSTRHQRYELVASLAEKPDQHLILVTATPHSGKEDSFRALLSLLKDEFTDLPADLTGPDNKHHRRELSRYFVQRRRADIQSYLDTQTPFPQREYEEQTYALHPDYERLFDRVLAYARETVQRPDEPGHYQRVRWWAALALLRALASSPAAAMRSLSNRAANLTVETAEEADAIGERTVLDLVSDESAESMDVTPGGDSSELDSDAEAARRRLQDMARLAQSLHGEKDNKLQQAVTLVKGLIGEGYSPILFCRFIPTVEYVVEHLRDALRGVEVAGITGQIPPAERELRVRQLAEAPRRVLVCTDALSEGINLQQAFDAVVHYDLSWNPTRHEQREGRVDRYGQPADAIKVVMYYGSDNKIDASVIRVLLEKHQTIRNSLGISVPVPVNTSEIIEAIFEGVLLHDDTPATQLTMPGFEDYIHPKQQSLFDEWDASAEREKRSRTMFAQRRIKVEDVRRELEAAQHAVGTGVDVARFLDTAVRAHGGMVARNGVWSVDLTETPRALRDMVGGVEQFAATFQMPVQDDELHLTRTHPIIEGLANYVVNAALDELTDSAARRAGVVRTSGVDIRTTLLVVRYRYHIIRKDGSGEYQLLAEDLQTVAFEGSPTDPAWLDEAEWLFDLHAEVNMPPQVAANQIRSVVENFDALAADLEAMAHQRGEALLDAHRRVRDASKLRGVRYAVEPQLPPDVLGVYVFLPKGRA
jgi:superfamily II DNA or RNA helicase